MRKLNIIKFMVLFGVIGTLIALPFIGDLVAEKPHADLVVGLIGFVLMLTGIQLLNVDLYTPGWKDKDLEYISGKVAFRSTWQVGIALAVMMFIALYAGFKAITIMLSSIVTDIFDFSFFAYYAVCMLFLLTIKLAKEKPPTN